MWRHPPFRVIFLLSLWTCQVEPTFAQTSNPKILATTEKTASQPKLTPQQKRGLRLLESAQAEAAALQPVTDEIKRSHQLRIPQAAGMRMGRQLHHRGRW